MDTAPNYATELLKCQRYFVRLKASAATISSITGFSVANTICRFGMPLPIEQRAYPTLTVSNVSDWGVSTTNGAGALVASAVTRQGRMGNIVSVEVTNSSITQSTPYILYALSSSAYMDFSADI